MFNKRWRAEARDVKQIFVGRYEVRLSEFVSVVMPVTGATSGALSTASIVAGYPRNAPTQ
jgi:hypothetical protein